MNDRIRIKKTSKSSHQGRCGIIVRFHGDPVTVRTRVTIRFEDNNETLVTTYRHCELAQPIQQVMPIRRDTLTECELDFLLHGEIDIDFDEDVPTCSSIHEQQSLSMIQERGAVELKFHEQKYQRRHEYRRRMVHRDESDDDVGSHVSSEEKSDPEVYRRNSSAISCWTSPKQKSKLSDHIMKDMVES